MNPVSFLLLISTALAGPETKIQRLLDKGAADKAAALCTEALQAASVEEGAHREACAEAHRTLAAAADGALAREQALLQVHGTWTGTAAATTALEEAAALGFAWAAEDPDARAAAATRYASTTVARETEKADWAALQAKPTSEAAQAFAAVWKDSVNRSDALTMATRLDFEAASSLADWRAFLERWPEAPQRDDALTRVVQLEFEAASTPEAWLAFLDRWPEAPQRTQAALRMVEATLAVASACSDGCSAIEGLDVTWTPPGPVGVSVALAGARDGGTVTAADAWTAWAGRLADQLPDAIGDLEGSLSPGQWTLVPTRALPRPPGLDDYRLLVQVGAASFEVPLQVTGALAPIQTGFVYVADNGFHHQPTPPQAPETLATFPGGPLESQYGETDNGFIVFGSDGLHHFDPLQRTATRYGDQATGSPLLPVNDWHPCWLFETGVFVQTNTGAVGKLDASLPSARTGTYGVTDDCSSAAFLDWKTQELRVYDLTAGRLVATHPIREPLGRAQTAWKLELTATEVFVEAPQDFHGGPVTYIAVDWQRGTERQVSSLPHENHYGQKLLELFAQRDKTPTAEAPPPTPGVTLSVEPVDGIPEVFVHHAVTQTRVQITDNAAIDTTNAYGCTALNARSWKVTAAQVPGMPVADISVLWMTCTDEMYGDQFEDGSGFYATLDGASRINKADNGAGRWSQSPNNKYLINYDRYLYDTALNPISLPEGATIVHWYSDTLTDWLP